MLKRDQWSVQQYLNAILRPTLRDLSVKGYPFPLAFLKEHRALQFIEVGGKFSVPAGNAKRVQSASITASRPPVFGTKVKDKTQAQARLSGQKCLESPVK